MADKLTELAMMFKERNNPNLFDICIADVVESRPLLLKISEKVFLGKEYNNLIVSETLHTIIPNIGDKIIVIPTSNGKLWYAIDKGVS